MSPRVSVVVATFRSERADLAALLRSIDAQTLPRDQLEVVLVDDGSPEEHWASVQELAAGRGGTVVHRIEHSGWPSRPRNVGTELARGEWVIYADQDDLLLPDGLRAAVEFAAEHDLDVVNLKEIETGNPGHALDAYATDRFGPSTEVGIAALLPMVPHKLYRRRMLLEHGVRFPEAAGGPGRVMWEDIYFTIDAYVAARRIGVLGRVGVYHHVIGANNASHAYRPETEEYWRTVVEVLEHAGRVLADPRHDADRAVLPALHYRDRVIGRTAALAARGDRGSLDRALPHARAIAERWVPPEVVAGFPLRDRRLAALLRAEDLDALGEAARRVAAIVGTARSDEVGWDGAGFTIAARGSWREPPSEVAPGLLGARDDAERDAIAAEAAAATLDLVLRERDSADTVVVGAAARVGDVDPVDPITTLTVAATARVDVAALPSGTYDVHARCRAFGFGNTRPVRYAGPVSVGVVHGRAVVAYSTRNGRLAVDIGGRVRSLVNSSVRDHAGAQLTRTGRHGVGLAVRLVGVHVVGTEPLAGTLAAVPAAGGEPVRVPARIAVRGDEAWLEARLTLPPGRYRLGCAFGGEERDSGMELEVPPRRPGRRAVLRDAPRGR